MRQYQSNYWIQYTLFLKAMSIVLQPTGIRILMIDITLQFENVIPDLISADQCTQNEVIFLMPYALQVTFWITQNYATYVELIGNYN